MIKLDAGNVLLKPSHRRQIMAWLKRSLRLGQRLGNFMLTIHLHRSGRQFGVTAEVQDAAGSFTCRAKRTDWRNALRDLCRVLAVRLHDQRLGRMVA